jgi:hypothetical protein
MAPFVEQVLKKKNLNIVEQILAHKMRKSLKNKFHKLYRFFLFKEMHNGKLSKQTKQINQLLVVPFSKNCFFFRPDDSNKNYVMRMIHKNVEKKTLFKSTLH